MVKFGASNSTFSVQIWVLLKNKYVNDENRGIHKRIDWED